MAIKRLNYFNGQFLREQDFTDEQTYHLDMRRRHNLRLHTPGVVFGLGVTPGTGKVTVQAGMAIDAQGREIILESATDLPITAATDITISFKEDKTDDTSETGIAGNRRWTETAALANSVNPNGIVLAKVTAVSPVTLNSSFRPSYSAPAVEGDLTVKRDLTVSGNLTVQGTTTTVNTQEMRGNVTLGDADTDTVTVEGRLLTGHSSGKLQIGSPVQLTGDLTTTGPVTLPANPTQPLQAATKQYIDSHTGAPNPHSGSLAKTGDTMSGALSITAPGTALIVTNGASVGTNLTVGGSVGIGTTVPTGTLTLSKAGPTTIVTENIKNDTHEMTIGVFDSFAMVSATTPTDLQLRTNNAIRAVIKANTGRVGIGTADPNEILHVKGNMALDGVIVQENWIAPTLLNGWVNAGSGFNPAGYFRDKEGIVHLRGLVKKIASLSVPPLIAGQPIFTLPPGYQPEFIEVRLVMSQNAPDLLGLGECVIDSGGNVKTIAGSTAFFCLDGISFRAVVVP
jgi:hypothetical protein